MAKNIIFCADGTWNNPDQDDDGDDIPDPTNVFKLFVCLEGRDSLETLLAAREQEKIFTKNGEVLQIAKYIHGVGDARNPISRWIGGAFGTGVISRIVRGYTFISRNYERGARIYIVGFSRGAYTARALAGLIATQGLLNPALTADKEAAYRHGARAWYAYREKTASSPSLRRLGEIVHYLPFVAANPLTPADTVPIEEITAVGVWDTVGALGIPRFRLDGNRMDAYKFCDTKLNRKVRHGFHAVAIDEQRNDFTPTLWDDAANVRQMLFPGAHADVGGGYPMAANQCGLSDGALHWMMQQLAGAGVFFAAEPAVPVRPDSMGTGHKPWLYTPWNFPGISLAPRVFPVGLPRHPSVQERMQAVSVLHEPGEAALPYLPVNLSDLSDRGETRRAVKRNERNRAARAIRAAENV